jgi:hypothetical protein
LSAIGYPRPAPSLTASDHVFFEDRTARAENRSRREINPLHFSDGLRDEAQRSSCAGLTRASIHLSQEAFVAKGMDFRVKPGNDAVIVDRPLHDDVPGA